MQKRYSPMNSYRGFLRRWLLATLAGAVLMSAGTALAVLGHDIEKPEPEFSRSAGMIIAKLIPRGKSTSVNIRFSVRGGNLLDVRGLDFEKAATPEVSFRDFRAALFVCEIDGVSPGAAVQLSVQSNFFTSSTQYWVHNPQRQPAWSDAGARYIVHPQRMRELVIQVTDGGPLDSDGEANGRLKVVGGPRDSFWGYAVGTLLIRFFGIFLVLSFLMFGMLFSGKIFQFIQKKAEAAEDRPAQAPSAAPVATEKAEGEKMADDPRTAAAIALALKLHLAGQAGSQPLCLSISRPSDWTLDGRERIMDVRLLTFQRPLR